MRDDSGQTLLGDVEKLRTRVRRDHRSASVPLLVFGALTLIGVVSASAGPRAPVNDPSHGWVWAASALVGFLVVAWWLRRRRTATGVGRRSAEVVCLVLAVTVALFAAYPPLGFWAAYAGGFGGGIGLVVVGLTRRNLVVGLWGLLVLVLTPVLGPVPLFASSHPALLVGAGLIVLGVSQRSRLLVACAVAYAVLGGLNALGVFLNVPYHLGLPDTIPAAAIAAALPGLLLLSAGLFAWRREQATID
jgi:hypothetical protein